MEQFKDSIYYTQEEFNKLWNSLKYLGAAAEGTCKRLNNREVIKYLNGPEDRGLTKEDILRFKNIKVKTYLFGYKVFFIDNILSGYITRYSAGKNLIEIDRDKIVFDKIISGSSIVEEDTKKYQIWELRYVMSFLISFIKMVYLI